MFARNGKIFGRVILWVIYRNI